MKRYVIKPLEWTAGKHCWTTRGALYNYSVSYDKGDKRYYSFAPGAYRWHRSLESAKANCERHHRDTLLACLEPA